MSDETNPMVPVEGWYFISYEFDRGASSTDADGKLPADWPPCKTVACPVVACQPIAGRYDPAPDLRWYFVDGYGAVRASDHVDTWLSDVRSGDEDLPTRYVGPFNPALRREAPGETKRWVDLSRDLLKRVEYERLAAEDAQKTQAPMTSEGSECAK